MIIISDTSPVSNLFIINRLHLLHEVYGKIIVPTRSPKLKIKNAVRSQKGGMRAGLSTYTSSS